MDLGQLAVKLEAAYTIHYHSSKDTNDTKYTKEAANISQEYIRRRLVDEGWVDHGSEMEYTLIFDDDFTYGNRVTRIY